MSEPERRGELPESFVEFAGRIEDQLTAIQDLLEHLCEVVREAVEELGVIRDIEDEKAADLQWAVRNGQPIYQLTSMPLDPADLNWGHQVNRFSAADVPGEGARSLADPSDHPAETVEPITLARIQPPSPSQTQSQTRLWPQDGELF